MAITRPFHRNIRSHIPTPNAGYSAWAFILEKDYAQNAPNFLRAYSIIQSDFERLCEYVQPSPEGLSAYSFRMHEMLMRICIEVEANFKAILNENISSKIKPNMGGYRKVDVTHHLSSYTLILTTWSGPQRFLRPFEAWHGPNGFGTGRSPEWYTSYNDSKHDRQDAFRKANFEQVINALAGLLAVLSSQFRTQDFSAGPDMISAKSPDYHELEPAIGSLFRIRFPDDWPDEEQYDFDWLKLREEDIRFGKIDYDSIQV